MDDSETGTTQAKVGPKWELASEASSDDGTPRLDNNSTSTQPATPRSVSRNSDGDDDDNDSEYATGRARHHHFTGDRAKEESSQPSQRRNTEEFVTGLPHLPLPVAAADENGNGNSCTGSGNKRSAGLASEENTRKISDILRRARLRGKTTVSFEFFPAKTETENENLLHQIERVGVELRPSFISLTWSADFVDEELWIQLADCVQKRFGISVLMHLTCHLSKEQLPRVLDRLRACGLRNILALRGDLPMESAGSDASRHTTAQWVQHKGKGHFAHAIDLVRMIREHHGNYFCVGVAGYPETHVGCWNNPHLPPSEQARALDLRCVYLYHVLPWL